MIPQRNISLIAKHCLPSEVIQFSATAFKPGKKIIDINVNYSLLHRYVDSDKRLKLPRMYEHG